ncbi:hypothetical protein BDK61_2555 [Haloarcula quadrata]|uniref:Methyltransferase family protein n=1 Tax=Haloarcula quadrata TaxID=182779 RepID=A0A495R7J3_9EURY|nr:class I SAM-dependent methyltransferase [Haloarcula quadrata]RKS83219.1 hypothetical protein BDK61_2555 [Haloarcula quadrata]
MVKQTKVLLGCGQIEREGWYGVDIVDTPECDQVVDLDTEKWDLPSDHFTHIRAINVFEHLENPINFVEEVHRIGTDGAVVEVTGPHRSSQNWTDPTHKRLLGTGTFSNYFTEQGDFNFYSDAVFEVEDVKVIFKKHPYFPHNIVAEKVFNISTNVQKLFESTFMSRLIPAQDIYFQLRVKKSA